MVRFGHRCVLCLVILFLYLSNSLVFSIFSMMNVHYEVEVYAKLIILRFEDVAFRNVILVGERIDGI